MPRLGHTIGVRVGPPLDYSSYGAGPRNPKLLREITDDIMTHIRRISGQDYVDRYAKRKADDGPETAQIASLPVIDDRPLVAAG